MLDTNRSPRVHLLELESSRYRCNLWAREWVILGQKLTVLLAEDSENDALLLAMELERDGFNPDIRRVETAEQMRRGLAERDFDIVIADYIMPRFNGLEALAIVRERGEDIPFILVSGKIGEDLAVEAIRMGANDYLMKSSLRRLGHSVRRSLDETRSLRERRKARDDLDSSLEQLKQTTQQLGESNALLRAEILERERAQMDALESKEYLRNVIDSATELVISVDKVHHITMWSRAVQKLTGYSERDVLNRGMDKLPVFADAREMMELVKKVDLMGKVTVEFTLITKDNTRKVVRAIGSTIRKRDQTEQGTLFVGKDITPDIEAHGKLLEGMGYLIRDKDSIASLDLFKSLIRSGRSGLLITRTNPLILGSQFPTPTEVEFLMLSQNEPPLPGVRWGHKDILQHVERFTLDNVKSVILLDGVHYLISKSTYEGFLDILFDIDEVVSRNRSILLVRIDPSILDAGRMGTVENELLALPSQRFDDVILGDDEFEVLRFINEQNENNVLVSLKKLALRFQLSHVTVARRIESLEVDGLVYVKRQGKLRVPYITDKGKALLRKRKQA
jgi:PAS domain S-box-containing protein